MRVALCLYGYYNNRSDKSAGDKGYAYIQSKIMKQAEAIGAEVDVFFHSWDIKETETIFNKYPPTHGVVEEQIDFNKIAKDAGINEAEINKGFNRNKTIYKQCTINASLSFFYSRSESIKYAIKHANKNGFEYDCVISCRFDLGQRSGWHKGYNVSLMELDFSLDMNYIYSAMWKQTNAGYADQWFFSNQENMEKLSTMYDQALTDYFHIGSDYQKAITSGWVDSNSRDELSNELLTPSDNVSLMVYPKWQMINNHIIHKWHFISSGLYEKSRFIGVKK